MRRLLVVTIYWKGDFVFCFLQKNFIRYTLNLATWIVTPVCFLYWLHCKQTLLQTTSVPACPYRITSSTGL